MPPRNSEKEQKIAARLTALEKRVDLALKGLNLLLFEHGEEISPSEKRILKKRLKEYTSGKKSEFVGSERASELFFTRK
jgi:hypothetical protein